MADGSGHSIEGSEVHEDVSHGAKGDLPSRPKIAFTGEEFGFGYQALVAYRDVVKKSDGRVPDAGRGAQNPGARRSGKVSIEDGYRLPLRTKEQSLAALATGNADLALVPFYSPDAGYDTETIQLVSSIFKPFGVDLVEARDHFCLAVYEPQVLDIVQASHPGSGLSELMRRGRSSWSGPRDRGEQWHGGAHGPNSVHANAQVTRLEAGLKIDEAGRLLLRDRVDTIFAGPEATRRCKSHLDGLRSAGVKVEETAQWIEPHREMSRRVRDSLDKTRQTNAFVDPSTGRMGFSSMMTAEAQTRPLYAVALPYEVALRSPDFTIIEENIEDGEAPKTRFLVCEANVDVTLLSDVYKVNLFGLYHPRVKHWRARLRGVLADARARADGKRGHGVRVLMQFSRGGHTMSIASLEAYLRYFGVRHVSFRLAEDSEGKKVSPIILDIEFLAKDFRSHFLFGSIVTGFLWKAFDLAKYDMAQFLAAVPFTSPQMPAHHQRRWWAEGVEALGHSLHEQTHAVFGVVGSWILHWPIKLLFNKLTVPALAVGALTLTATAAFVFREPILALVMSVARGLLSLAGVAI